MVGRESERARIEQMLERVPLGPAGLALEGAPGIGKTTLWREGVESARRRGCRVIATVPSEPDARLAFAGLGDLLDGVPGEIVADLPEPQRRALSVALLAEGGEGAEPDARALPRAVLSVLRALSGEGPLLVAIDDEQWLDRASARVLAFALCRLRDEPIGVLLARRPESGGLLADELARGFDGSGLPVAAVGPLDANSIRELVASGNDRTIPRALMRRIEEISEGNPLYALAITLELETRPDRGRDVPIPRTLEDAIARRLEHLEARARDALLVVAMLSHPTVAVIHSVLSDFTVGDLDDAVSAGVVEIARDRVDFMHPLLASTVYSRASPARRRELHRVIAKVTDDEEQRARHLALGAEAPDRRIAAAIEEAAHKAAWRGAPDVAASLLEDAARLTPSRDAAARRSRLVDAAQLHAAGGDVRCARKLLGEVLPEFPHGPARARTLLQLAHARMNEDLCAAQALFEQALGEAGDDHRLRAEIELGVADLLNGRAEFAESLRHARSALESAKRANDHGLLAVATSSYEVGVFFSGGVADLEAVRGGIEFEDSAEIAPYRPSVALAQILFWLDDYAHARPALEQAIRSMQARGEIYDTGFLVMHLVLLEWYSGNPEEAERHRLTAEELVRDQGEPSLDLMLMYFESLFAAEAGDLEAARVRALAALELAERIGDPLFAAFPSMVLAYTDLWSGQAARAHDRLSATRDSFLANGFGFIGSISIGLWMTDIEALLASGRLDEAQSLVDDLLRRSRAENPHAIAIAERCRGLLLAARGDIPGAIEAMDAALAEHARRLLRPELARTLLEKGALQRRAKQKSAAKQTLEQALAVFEASGAQMWIERTRDELSRIGLRRSTASDGLTPAQTRVAELVVAGKSNREIASTLYMSQRSVESHLTKIYRGFGVRSRAQLIAALATTAAQGQLQADGQNGDVGATTSTGPGTQTGERAAQRVRRAFMFTDIVDSTPLVSLLGDDAWVHLLQWHDRTLRALFGSYLGEEVDHAGDGFFVAFERADAAVRCAEQIQQKLEHHRRENGFAPKVRIGVHLDQANYLAGSYHGHGVHVAARIGAQAQGGEILTSRETLNAVGDGTRVGPARIAQLKGVTRPVELIPVIWS